MEDNEILRFQLDITLGATITVESVRGTQDWIKPSVSSGITWRSIPDPEQLKSAVEFITHHVLEPTLSDISQTVLERERALKSEMTH